MKIDKKKIFITWALSNTRSASLAKELDFKAIFIGRNNKHNNSINALISYVGRTLRNIQIILIEKPDVIAISNFHWIIAFVNVVLAKLTGAKIILDSHSAAFDHPFHKYPKFLSYYFAKIALFSLVTNEVHKNLLISKGAAAIVLPDIPNEENLFLRNEDKIDENFNVCFICTFNYDEPYEEVFKAAANLDKVTIHITGNYKDKVISPEKYKNVNFTGFLPDYEYVKLINKVDAILVLTTRENTMQSGGSEAISVEKPLITSDTEMLRNYFELGTVFVNNCSKSICNGIEFTKTNYEKQLEGIISLKEYRKQNFSENILFIKKLINNQSFTN